MSTLRGNNERVWDWCTQEKLGNREASTIAPKDVETGANLVSAHEMLICADLEKVNQSERGRNALADLHRVCR